MPVSPFGFSALVSAEVFAVDVEMFLGYGHRFGLLISAPMRNCVRVVVNLCGVQQLCQKMRQVILCAVRELGTCMSDRATLNCCQYYLLFSDLREARRLRICAGFSPRSTIFRMSGKS